MIDNLTQQTSDSPALFPAIAIPVQSKIDFEMPPGHLELLKSIFRQLTKLLIIGWRATDAPFLQLFSEERETLDRTALRAGGNSAKTS